MEPKNRCIPEKDQGADLSKGRVSQQIIVRDEEERLSMSACPSKDKITSSVESDPFGFVHHRYKHE